MTEAIRKSQLQDKDKEVKIVLDSVIWGNIPRCKSKYTEIKGKRFLINKHSAFNIRGATFIRITFLFTH